MQSILITPLTRCIRARMTFCGKNAGHGGWIVVARKHQVITCRVCRAKMHLPPYNPKPLVVPWDERVRDFFGAISR